MATPCCGGLRIITPDERSIELKTISQVQRAKIKKIQSKIKAAEKERERLRNFMLEEEVWHGGKLPDHMQQQWTAEEHESNKQIEQLRVDLDNEQGTTSK